MDDYAFLENISRGVSEWGQDIARGGYETIQSRRGRGGMGRGNKTRDGMSRKKRDMLRLQLELRDVEIDLLPVGMERRTRNHSTWEPKCVIPAAASVLKIRLTQCLILPYRRKRTVFLTVEYIIHSPLAIDASTNNEEEPCTLLTHRNNFDLSLRDLFQTQILQRTKGKARTDLPSWVKTLALPHPDIPDAFTPPQFFIRAPLGLLPGQREKFGFIMMDGERKLSALLRNKQFVEFPTIEVWEEGAFRGVLLDDAGAIESRGGQNLAKRPKLDVTKGRAAIAGLLGGYGSEDDEEADTALNRLGDYAGSDAENEQATTSEADTDGSAEDDDEDDDDEELDAAVDPEMLLAMVQESQRQHGEDGEYDDVDWGESDKDS